MRLDLDDGMTFVAAELKAISVRLDALAELLGKSTVDTAAHLSSAFSKMERHFDVLEQKWEDFDRRAKERHQEVMRAVQKIMELTQLQEGIEPAVLDALGPCKRIQ